MNKIRQLTTLLLILIILLANFATAIHIIQKNTIFFNNKSNQIFYYINAENHYDYGYKTGKKYYFFYKVLDFFVKSVSRKQTGDGYAEKTLENLSIYSPWLVEELEGLGNSTNIEIKDLLNIFNSLFPRDQQCTVVLATGNATKNNETFLAQNFDSNKQGLNKFFNYFLKTITHFLIIADIQCENYTYVFSGIPILYELPLMNQEGLGFGANGITLTKNNTRYIDEGTGISTYNLERLTMMRCKNISEVQKLWKNSIRSSGRYRSWPHFWDNSAPSFCDKKGDIITIEQSHKYTFFVYRNSTDITKTYNDILWHTNHHQFLNPNLTGSIYPGEKNIDNSSFLRSERAVELLEQNYGNITIDVIKEIMRDHEGGTNKKERDSSDICRYPDKNSSSTTIFSWIIIPQKKMLYLAHNIPDKTRYQCVDLTDIFS